MTSWDLSAVARLDQITDTLTGCGAIDLIQPIIAHVWAGNVDRYDPAIMGDTNGSIGYTASENIATLTVRRWRETFADHPDLRVAEPDNSLLLATGSIRVHPMKAPPSVRLSEPNWFDDFGWGRSSVSHVRRAAAAANTVNHDPYAIPGTLFSGTARADNGVDLSNVCETFLIWAGGTDDAATGGWLGLPVFGEQPWLAVRRLWWDETGSPGMAVDPAGPTAQDHDTFTDRAEPRPEIRIKRDRGAGQQ